MSSNYYVSGGTSSSCSCENSSSCSYSSSSVKSCNNCLPNRICQQVTFSSNIINSTLSISKATVIAPYSGVPTLYTLTAGQLLLPFGFSAQGYISSYLYFPETGFILPSGTLGIGIVVSATGVCSLYIPSTAIATLVGLNDIVAISSSPNYATSVDIQVRFWFKS